MRIETGRNDKSHAISVEEIDNLIDGLSAQLQ